MNHGDGRKTRKPEPQSRAALARIYGLLPKTVGDRLAAAELRPDVDEMNGKVRELRWVLGDAVHATLSGSALPWGTSTGRASSQRKEGNVYDLEEERARQTHHDANIKEINEATLLGDRVPMDEVIEHLTETHALVRQAVENIPGQCAAEIARMTGHELGPIRSVIVEQTRKTQAGLAGQFFTWAARHVGRGVAADLDEARAALDAVDESAS